MKATEINVYVGRWDLLPEDWEGINGLYEKTEAEIKDEVNRQNGLCIDDNRDDRDYIGVYPLEEFEDEFNQSLSDWITSKTYWIKFF